MVEDSTPGRLEGEDRMTAYVDQMAAEGWLSEDDYWSNPDGGEGMIRSGRRIFEWSSQGFVSLTKYPTVEAATRAWHPDDCVMCANGWAARVHTYDPPKEDDQ